MISNLYVRLTFQTKAILELDVILLLICVMQQYVKIMDCVEHLFMAQFTAPVQLDSQEITVKQASIIVTHILV